MFENPSFFLIFLRSSVLSCIYSNIIFKTLLISFSFVKEKKKRKKKRKKDKTFQTINHDIQNTQKTKWLTRIAQCLTLKTIKRIAWRRDKAKVNSCSGCDAEKMWQWLFENNRYTLCFIRYVEPFENYDVLFNFSANATVHLK